MIHPGAKIDPTAVIAGFAEIGPKAVIGKNCLVYSATVEGEIGEGTKIWRYAHVREGAKIGKDCMLGQCGFVAPFTNIGDGVKIQNHTNVSMHVTIEDNVFIGAGVQFCNGAHPTAGIGDALEPITVKTRASVGSNVSLIGRITIGEDAVIGANAAVTKDVPPGARVLGVPGRIK